MFTTDNTWSRNFDIWLMQECARITNKYSYYKTHDLANLVYKTQLLVILGRLILGPSRGGN